jgi:HEPN domain-containing protein
LRQEALDWLHIAEQDLRHAEGSVEMQDYDWACFAAQQAAEKAMKAVVIGVGRRRPSRSHDLSEFRGETEPLGLRVDQSDSTTLSQYYVTSRYPNAGLHRPYESFTRQQAQQAIEMARRIVEGASRLLTVEGNGGDQVVPDPA